MSESIPLDPDRDEGALDAGEAAKLTHDGVEARASDARPAEDPSRADDDEGRAPQRP